MIWPTSERRSAPLPCRGAHMVSTFQLVEPIRLSMTLKYSFDHTPVTARLRPFPSQGRPHRTGPLIRLTVEPPAGVDLDRWRWNLQQAANVLTIIDVTDDFYDMDGRQRYYLLVSRITEVALGER